MRRWAWATALLIYWLAEGTAAVCPEGCSCADKSVVCSCEDTSWDLQNPARPRTRLQLTPFRGHIDFTGILVVHSCDQVLVPNDTFHNVDVLDQIKFLHVGQLELEPHAFRGIRTSPRQLVIQDSGLPRIPAQALAGLRGMDHLWLRNVTIGRVQKLAFAKLADIQYVYFRDVAINTIESGAFAHMYNISYFYMREKVMVKSMGDFLFVGSSINEVVVERAYLHATDLTFAGLHAAEAQFKNVKMNVKKAGHVKQIPSQEVGRVTFEACVMNRVVLSFFYNTSLLEFERTKVGHLQASPQVPLRNISTVLFKQSIISHWHSHVFSSASGLDSVIVDSSSIGTIHPHAIYGSELDSVAFVNSQIGAADAKAFSRNDMQQFVIEDTFINTAKSHLFYGSQIQNLTISGGQIKELRDEALGMFNASIAVLERLQLGMLPSALFAKSFVSRHFSRRLFQIDELFLRSCQLDGQISEDVFSGMMAYKLAVTDNQLNCSETSCEFNSLLLNPSKHPISWMFDQNRCASPYSNPCIDDFENDLHPGLICRRRVLMEECICADPSTEVVYWPTPNVSMVLLGDCPHLRVVRSELRNPALQAMYIYRVGMLELVSIDSSLSQLHILHSRVEFSQPYGLSRLQLYQLRLVGATIDSTAPLSFADSTIDFLHLNGSTLRFVSGNTFSNSLVHNLDAQRSLLLAVSNLFEQTRQLTIRESVLHDTRGLENVTELCLTNNSINCDCILAPDPLRMTCDALQPQCVPRENGLETGGIYGCAQQTPSTSAPQIQPYQSGSPRNAISLLTLLVVSLLH